MTLIELMDKVDIAEYTDRVPSPLWLANSGSPVVASETFSDGSIMKAYQNGYIMYKRDRHMTVFPLHSCTDYREKDLMDQEHVIHFETFSDQPWQVRTLMEGERRLAHINSIRQSRHEDYSLDAYYEENKYSSDKGKCDPFILVTEDAVRREESVRIRAALEEFSERQRWIITECIVKRRKQEDIASELGTSRSNVSSILRKSLKRLRTMYGCNSPQPQKRNRNYRKDRFAGQRAF